MGIDPCNCTMKIWDSNSHNESSVKSVRVHSLKLFALSDLPIGSQPCNPFALVMSPRLGL
jgi:hypothetical protein